MTQAKLSYEEQIINAMNNVGGPKRKPPESSLEYTERQFNAIRSVLQPLYDQVKRLEDEQKVGQARHMAVRYASKLAERLEEFRIEDKELPTSDTSVRHLIWMCQQIVEHTGYVPNEWSVTKLHRWIGYIQGVMVARGFTTVLREREDYKQLKQVLLKELSLPSQDI